MSRWLSRICLVLLAAALPFSGQAADTTLRPAAVVNDEAISELDLDMRVRLVMLTSGLPDTPQQRQRIVEPVLDGLIEERLQLQEAERLGIEVDDADVQQQIERIARGNDMTAAQLMRELRNAGILPQSFEEQIRANIAWRMVVGQRIRPEVQISPEEVDAAINRLREQEGEQQLRAREIFVAFGEGGGRDQAERTVERLIQQLRQGADFGALAQQFSQSPTASVGGDMGWVTAESLPDGTGEALRGMNRGDIAGPIETFNGFHLVQLIDRRRISAGDERVRLQQIFVDIPEDAPDDEIEGARAEIREVAREVASCSEMSALAEEMGGVGSGDLGTLSIGDLPENIRTAIADLPTEEPSEPLRVGGGISVLMVCEREFEGVDRDEIAENLMRERLNLRVQRYMRDLRRDANIDIRL